MSKQTLHAGRTIRCLLFDFGDTLWTRNLATYEQVEQRARRHAIELVSDYINPQLFPTSDKDLFGILLQKQLHKETRHRMREKIGYEPDFADATLSALERLGLPRLDDAAGAAIYEALRVRIPESRAVFPDTFATLTGLQERGYILGVVTNRGYGGVPFREDLHQIEFDRFFDLSAMAVSADLGIRKPNPDIFLYAMNKLGVSPHETAMIGDSLHADIQGANLLNLFSIWRPKEHIRQDLRASLKGRTTTSDTQQSSPAEMALHENDDDFVIGKEDLFLYAQQNQKYEYHIPGGNARPNHIIYTLSELLDLF